MYPDEDSKIHVSWCILICIQCWHIGSEQDTRIFMYLYVSYLYPKCILDSFGIRVKYMQNIKIHVFSWNVTEHLRYIWDTSRYTQDTCIIKDTRTIHQDTIGYVSYRPPPNRIGTPPTCIPRCVRASVRLKIQSNSARRASSGLVSIISQRNYLVNIGDLIWRI